jgi:predicted transcriptional regulator
LQRVCGEADREGEEEVTPYQKKRARHARILLLSDDGLTPGQIAARVGLSETTVREILRGRRGRVTHEKKPAERKEEMTEFRIRRAERNDRIVAMAAKGVDVGRIAGQVGLSERSVAIILQSRTQPAKPASRTRVRLKLQRAAVKLHRKGLDLGKIAGRLGRGEMTIRNYLIGAGEWQAKSPGRKKEPAAKKGRKA